MFSSTLAELTLKQIFIRRYEDPILGCILSWSAVVPNVFWHLVSESHCCIVRVIGLRASLYTSPRIVSHIFMIARRSKVSPMEWGFLFWAIKFETSKGSRSTLVKAVLRRLNMKYLVEQLGSFSVAQRLVFATRKTVCLVVTMETFLSLA
jgi:hypothetical protein